MLLLIHLKNTVVQILIDTIDFNMPIKESVEKSLTALGKKSTLVDNSNMSLPIRKLWLHKNVPPTNYRHLKSEKIMEFSIGLFFLIRKKSDFFNQYSYIYIY